jgi:hypothetical protein
MATVAKDAEIAKATAMFAPGLPRSWQRALLASGCMTFPSPLFSHPFGGHVGISVGIAVRHAGATAACA